MYTIFAIALVVALSVISGDAFAQGNTVMGAATTKAVNVFKSIKTIVFVVGGFGLVGLAFQAIFGKVKWTWFAGLAVGLAVLAAAGSAVGLGNIWRFPYLAAKYGGGMFLLVYILLAVTFGFTLMVAEIALGRKSQLSAVSAFSKLNRKFTFLGYLASFVPIIILPYYSVIGGWVTKYLVTFCSGNT